jgi:hypothetical protein
VGAEEVAGHGLATVLVYPLQHLVAGGVAETREQRDELPPDRGAGLVLEDDGVELREGADLYRDAGQPLTSPLSIASTGPSRE